MVALRFLVPITLWNAPATCALISTSKAFRLMQTCIFLAQNEGNDADSLSSIVSGTKKPAPQQLSPTTSSSLTSSTPSSPHHEFQVWYRDQNVKVNAEPGESILAALERHRVFEQLGLGSAFPSDCRRGNCLTCAVSILGHHVEDPVVPASPAEVDASSSSRPSLLRTDDGLSPELSRWMARRGVVLACSSYVQGPGVQLRLRDDGDSENHALWDTLYRHRLEDESTQRVARKAMARVIRRRAERHPDEWAQSTEKALRQSPGTL